MNEFRKLDLRFRKLEAVCNRFLIPWIIMLMSLNGCSIGPAAKQPASEMQTPSEIVRKICGTDESPQFYTEPAQVRSLRGLLSSDLYDKLLERAELITHIKMEDLSDPNDRMLFADIKGANPFDTQTGLSANANLAESISGDKATVVAPDDYYGQDGKIGVLRLNFYFQRFGPNWVLLDEVIITEDTRPDWKNTYQTHLIENLNSYIVTFRKMKKR